MEATVLKCPQCGGALDLTAVHDGLARCVHCDAVSALSREQDHLQKINTLELPRSQSPEDLLEKLKDQLEKNGIEPLPEILQESEHIRYIARRGRARVTPRHRERGTIAEEHQIIREGVFGLPLDESEDAGLIFYEDVDALVPAEMQVPDDLEGHLLAFADRIDIKLELDAEAQLFAKTRPIQYPYNWQANTNWRDDVYLIDAPVAVFVFEFHGAKNTWKTSWSGKHPDGFYEAAYNLHDGKILRSRIPRKGPNFLFLFVAFIVVTTVLPTLLSIVGTLIGMVVAGGVVVLAMIAAALGF